MAGPFAHMILADTLCQGPDLLDSIKTLTGNMKFGLMSFSKFVELGAVSPDLPYLKRVGGNATPWGNVMHYWKTGDFIRSAVPYIYDLDWRQSDTLQCIAWLFGYTAHVVTDCTIHPVVNLRVGRYEGHELEHRLCEMHQDAHIFHKITGQAIEKAEYVKSCGIAECKDGTSRKRLNKAVQELWTDCLKSIAVEPVKMENKPAPKHPAAPDGWFLQYVLMIDDFAEEGGRFPWLFRRLGKKKGFFYPTLNEIDESFIAQLKTPFKTRISYDQLFEQAQRNVQDAWSSLGVALDKGKPDLFTLPNMDLETGLTEKGEPIFWRNA